MSRGDKDEEGHNEEGEDRESYEKREAVFILLSGSLLIAITTLAITHLRIVSLVVLIRFLVVFLRV